MKTTAIVNTFSQAAFQLKKHAPTILVAIGIVSGIGSTVVACKATTKASEVLKNTKNELDEIHECLETVDPEVYSDEDGKKDIVRVYAKTGVELAKLYAPAIGLGVLSIGCALTSHNIMRGRNMALAAAYATVDHSFKDYRNRVIDRFGEKVDRELKYNLKEKKVTQIELDEETGKEKKIKTLKSYADPGDVSGYARFFEEYTRNDKGEVIKNTCWVDNNEYNLTFLKAQQRYANDLLVAHGHLFLNDVYKMLGLPVSKSGQIVGWIYDPKNPNAKGDNYVDFGIYASNQNYSDFIYNDDEAILLDFNVDGNIWELM